MTSPSLKPRTSRTSVEHPTAEPKVRTQARGPDTTSSLVTRRRIERPPEAVFPFTSENREVVGNQEASSFMNTSAIEEPMVFTVPGHSTGFWRGMHPSATQMNEDVPRTPMDAPPDAAQMDAPSL